MKVFGIGLSRTGTLSLTQALCQLGIYTVHAPLTDEAIREHDASTDVPIAAAFKKLDLEYPRSRFIYTVRDLQAWLRSMKNVFRASNLPAANARYRVVLRKLRARFYGTSDYDEEHLRGVYNNHDADVRKYFYHRGDDLLILDICAGDGWEKLCPFLGKEAPEKLFPHHNKWSDVLAYKGKSFGYTKNP